MDHFPTMSVPDTADTAWLPAEPIGYGATRPATIRNASLGTPSAELEPGFYDSHDVAGVPMAYGLIGTVPVGGLATPQVPAAVKGLLEGANFDQPVRASTVLARPTAILALIVRYTIGLRAGEEDEKTEAAETGNDFAVAPGGSIHALHAAEE